MTPDNPAQGEREDGVAPQQTSDDEIARRDSGGAAFEPGDPPAKLDPEALELRARPRRVVRFRRGLLIASAAGLACAIAAIAWVALQPVGLRLASKASELHPADGDPSPEALERLPSSYGDKPVAVPDLGPPLPGDLGRPILEQQRAMATEGGSPVSDARNSAAQAAAADHERRRAEIAQARAAPVLMQVSGAPPRASGTPGEGAAVADGRSAPTGTSLPGGGDAGANPARLRAPVSRWQVSAGSVIAASLITGLNSDLPGLVVAQVTEPVFDSATGRTVLIPQGARLLGRYDSRVAFGQRRAMVLWERLVMPDGASIALDNAPATDAAGFAGLSDRVDFHTWRLLKGIALSTLLGVGTELTFGEGEDDLVRAWRESVQSNADRAGQKIVERNLDLAPTITVRPGYPVRVLVHKDLVLPPWRGGSQ